MRARGDVKQICRGYAQAVPASGRPICAEFYTFAQILDGSRMALCPATPHVSEYASKAGLLLQCIIKRRNIPAPEIASVNLILLVLLQPS